MGAILNRLLAEMEFAGRLGLTAGHVALATDTWAELMCSPEVLPTTRPGEVRVYGMRVVLDVALPPGAMQSAWPNP